MLYPFLNTGLDYAASSTIEGYQIVLTNSPDATQRLKSIPLADNRNEATSWITGIGKRGQLPHCFSWTLHHLQPRHLQLCHDNRRPTGLLTKKHVTKCSKRQYLSFSRKHVSSKAYMIQSKAWAHMDGLNSIIEKWATNDTFSILHAVQSSCSSKWPLQWAYDQLPGDEEQNQNWRSKNWNNRQNRIYGVVYGVPREGRRVNNDHITSKNSYCTFLSIQIVVFHQHERRHGIGFTELCWNASKSL